MLCRRLHKIVFPTQFSQEEAIRIAPWLKPKTTVIHNGVTPNDDSLEDQLCARQRARRLLNIPLNALVIGNAGWLIPRKRFDVFLQVASRIHKVRPEAVFVICGGGPLEEELRRKAAELGIADAVRFEGWVQDLEPFYQAFDVLLFNSDYDTFGLTALEAANHGAIVVASVRYGGLGEFIEHGTNGFLFKEHDAEAMAGIILSLGENGASASIRKNARERIQRDYDISASAAQYEQLFRSC
jgi:glycosyltransferase involved in cell wall biosynthesis